jgi:hypothetical protein
LNVVALVSNPSPRSFFSRIGVQAQHLQRIVQLGISPLLTAHAFASSQLRCQGEQRVQLLRCSCLLSKLAFLLALADGLEGLRSCEHGIIVGIMKRCLGNFASQLWRL